MRIDDKIHDEKLLALLSGKIDKYERPTGEEYCPSDQSRIIEPAKFTDSPLRKAIEKQIKTIKDHGIKQVEALKALKPNKNKQDIKSINGTFSKQMKTNEIKNEINEIKKKERKI